MTAPENMPRALKLAVLTQVPVRCSKYDQIRSYGRPRRKVNYTANEILQPILGLFCYTSKTHLSVVEKNLIFFQHNS